MLFALSAAKDVALVAAIDEFDEATGVEVSEGEGVADVVGVTSVFVYDEMPV